MTTANKIKIWNKVIPGNSHRKKSEVMEIKKGGWNNKIWLTLNMFHAVKAGKFKDVKRTLDTYTDKCVKMTDDAYNECFEDIPYLIPYIASGSKKAVIVVPGGGYCMKEMRNEGTLVAEKLQENGITAFVLWYRSNPYYQPYPLMDLQRAVRYVRFYAKDYGYDQDKIGAIGFSAGGAQVTLFQNVLRGGWISLPEYEKDEIDLVDDTLNFMAPVYPALGYRENQCLMWASFPGQEVHSSERRRELIDQYDPIRHMNSADIPQFVSYGTKDNMVSLRLIREYIDTLIRAGGNIQELAVEKAGHGYGAAINSQYGYWLEKYINWVTEL